MINQTEQHMARTPPHLKDSEQALPEAVEVVPRLIVLAAEIEPPTEYLRKLHSLSALHCQLRNSVTQCTRNSRLYSKTCLC